MHLKRVALLLVVALAMLLADAVIVDAKKPPKPPPPPGDQTPPAAMADFVVHATTDDTVTLRWTAPGDDGMDGYATLYDVRYRVGEPVTEDNWLVSLLAWDEPVPARSGFTEQYSVIGLTEDTNYYFAAIAIDDEDNVSDISASVSASTASADEGDWVKEIAFCKYDPDDPFVCGTPGFWKGMDVYVDGTETKVAMGLGHGLPRFVERSGGSWSTDDDVADAGATGIDTAYSLGGVQTLAFYHTGDEELKFATKAGSSWTLESIDADAEDPNLGGAPVSLAYDPDPANNDPTLAYSAAVGRNRKKQIYLRFAERDSGVWNITDVTEAHVSNVDLTYDPDGLPTIAYAVALDGSAEIRLARWDGSAWSLETAGTGYPRVVDDITLAYEPGTGDPVILHAGDFENDGLLLLRYDSATGQWSETPLADDWDAEPFNPSLAFNSTGVPYVCFNTNIPYDERSGNRHGRHDQWFMWSDDGGASWRSQWLDRYADEAPCRVGVDPQTDLPLVGYAKKPARFAYVKPDPAEYPDNTPPDAVGGLGAVSGETTHDSIKLEWTATGDDGTTGGRASEYDVRYSVEGPLTEATWDDEPLNQVMALVDPVAFPGADNVLQPGDAGTTQSIVVDGLADGTQYHFGFKVRDEVGNWSDLAATTTGETTTSAGPGDWAIDFVNSDCSGGCGNHADIDVLSTGVVGAWFVADGQFSHSYRAPGADWQHEMLSGGVDDNCVAFAYSGSGEPWATTCKNGSLDVMYRVGTTWYVETVDSQVAQGNVSMDHHAVTDEPHIAYYRNGSMMHARRDGGTWHTEEVHGELNTTTQWLAFHPTLYYPTIAYGAPWWSQNDDGRWYVSEYDIRFADTSSGSWSTELVTRLSPAPQSGVLYMAYHPLDLEPAILYEGPINEGLRYQLRDAGGWGDAVIIDEVDPAQTGGNPYAYRAPALAFGADGTAYASYRGIGDYAVFRMHSIDDVGNSVLVHSEAPTMRLTHDAAVNPQSGLPLFSYGVDPLRVIELLPTP